MSNVLDVTQYILEQTGTVSTWKLQKLIYYSQAWHAVWEDTPLFDSRIEAWANGPVAPALYERHRGMFVIHEMPGGNASNVRANERESIDLIIDYYGKMNGQQLSDLTHSEAPWQDARNGLEPGDPCNREITLESMTNYYSSLE